MKETSVQQLFSFIEANPTPFHVIQNVKTRLEKEGYEQLLEGQEWKLKESGKYYVIRNGSAIMAFRIPKKDFVGFQIMACHSDSPCFKIKENPEMEAEGHYVKLNVEKYGGFFPESWLDRPLSVAGRLMVAEGDKVVTKLVNVDRDLVMLPSLAIHMTRDSSDQKKLSIQKDMLPLFGDELSKGTFLEVIAEAAGVKKEQIVGDDLFLYNRMKGSTWGANNEYIAIGKLDDQQCAFSSMEAFISSSGGESIPVLSIFDNEEVGSSTKQGAASTFLLDTLLRINEGLGRSESQYRQAIASSLMVSADNGHAVHPNYPEKACPTNRPYMNGGVVIKYSANQKYTTDAVSAGLFRQICKKAKVPYQNYLNNSDILGGSTLGNISGNQVALNSVDIGLAQLAMHAPYETAGAKDTEYLIKAGKVFFESCVREVAAGEYEIGWK